MATLAQLKRKAEKLGATIERERIGITTTCTCESPHGYRWCDGGGLHMFVDDVYTGPNDYADIMSRMDSGLEKCPPDCEWCYPEEEDNSTS